MKALVAVVVAVLVGFAAWHVHQAKQAPVTAFETFATLVARGQYGQADAFTDGPIADITQGDRYGVVGWVPVQELRSVKYEVTSRVAHGDDVDLTVLQTVGFNPPGVESAMRSAMHGRFKQTATMHHASSGWKVTAFHNEFLGAE